MMEKNADLIAGIEFSKIVATMGTTGRCVFVTREMTEYGISDFVFHEVSEDDYREYEVRSATPNLSGGTQSEHNAENE